LLLGGRKRMNSRLMLDEAAKFEAAIKSLP
jgi:hypothetical protein